MYRSKMIKLIILVVLIASAVVGGVIFFMLSADKMTPEAIAAREEAYRQEWGYEQRIQEIVEMKGYKDSFGRKIIDTLLNDVGLPEILSVEDNGKNLIVTTKKYEVSVMLFGVDVDKVKIGKALIYRRLAPDSTQIIIERLYTYQEIDNIVKKFEKDMKLGEQEAAKLYTELSLLDIFSFSDVKKSKTEDKQEIAYKGKYIETPIEIVLKGNSLQRVYIKGLEYKEIGEILIYSKGEKEEETFKDYTLSNMSRAYIPDSLAYQIGEQIGATLRFQVAIGSGDDSWVMVKLAEDKYYFEANADVTINGKTTSEEIIAIREGQTTYSYLKVGRKKIIE